MTYYPIFLDIDAKRCEVIGGGAVALRKVNMLLDHGANIEVISPAICSELDELLKSGYITAIQREYQSGDLEGAFLVVAATDSEAINEEVAKEAAERGILINVVDVPKLSNFIVPSYLRRGDMSIAISTNGKSPALARKIRSDMEQRYGEEYAALVSLVDEVRSELREEGRPVSAERWQEALDLDALLELLNSGQYAQAKQRLLDGLVR